MIAQITVFGAGGAGKKFMETYQDNRCAWLTMIPKTGKNLAGKKITLPQPDSKSGIDAIVIASEFEKRNQKTTLIELGMVLK